MDRKENGINQECNIYALGKLGVHGTCKKLYNKDLKNDIKFSKK